MGWGFLLGVLVFSISWVTPSSHPDRLLTALEIVESGGDCCAIGDRGKAIGPLQIHYRYWQDAVAWDVELQGFPYTHCFNRDYARRVVAAYWARYAPSNASYEVLARIHNGGPKGHLKASTLAYWSKVKKILDK